MLQDSLQHWMTCPNHLHNVEMSRFCCPQTLLGLDCQCRDDISALKQTIWGGKELYQHATAHLKHPSCLTSCVELQHSKQLLWGWYTLRYYPPDALLEAIAKRLTPLVHNMDARTLSEFIWAFGGLNYEPSNMQLFLQVCLSQMHYRHSDPAPLPLQPGCSCCKAF